MADMDRIPDERLFQNNTRDEIRRWGSLLRYFHYMRARGGHNCEGDSFCAYFRYAGKKDLMDRLSQLGVTLNKLEDGYIAYDPFESYTFEQLDRLKNTIPGDKELEQPHYVTVSGQRVHIWVQPGRMEISVSGSGGGAYKVSEADFEVCAGLEKIFDKLGWNSILDNDVVSYPHCISCEKYPELFG